MTILAMLTKVAKMAIAIIYTDPLKCMQPGVPAFIKQEVIQDWFRGLIRDEIAEKHNIGKGTVTNIIRDWVADLEDGDVADAMRYFAVAFRKLKLTISQCALGARACNMLNNLGIEANDFDAFISGTYKFLKELAVDPKKMAFYVKQLEDLGGTMPVEQIPKHISDLHTKKEQASQEIERLRSNESNVQAKVDELKKEAHYLRDPIQRFFDMELVLKKYGVKIDDFESLAKAVKEARRLGYYAETIVTKLTYWRELEKKELDTSTSAHCHLKGYRQIDFKLFGLS